MQILVAEDDRVNRMLLQRWLERWGYDVQLAEDGDQAWQIIQKPESPSLLLMDWVMPGLDGMQVLEKLHEIKGDRFFHTIMLTSKTQKKDVVAALDAGADDFLSKPFNPPELRSRLAAGVRNVTYEQKLRSQNQQLERYGAEMQALAEARAKQLIHADRMATLGVMAAGIAHEINNPTAFISGNVQTLERIWERFESLLKSCLKQQEPPDETLDYALEQMPEILQGMKVGVHRISEIVRGLSAYSRQDQAMYEPTDIHQRIEQALTICHGKLKKHVVVRKKFEAEKALVLGAPSQIEQVLVNLFVNAADAMADKGQGFLDIRTQQTDSSSVRIIIEDTGPGVSEELREKIFDPFFTTKEVGKGTGLGLAISMGIIEDHKGTLTVENRVSGGACFRIQLPLAEDGVRQ